MPYGASGRNRTYDAGIFSPSLYHLSYQGLRQGAFFHRFCNRLLCHASSTSLWLSAPLMCGGRQDLNRPRIYLALPQSSPPYNKAQFFDKGRISPCLFRTFLIAVCAFTRCILTHTENFTPHPPGPKPGVHLFEPMRALWLFASFWLFDSPFYKTHLLNIFSEIKNRINCCLCLKVSLKNGSISRCILEQWASESFHCLPFS